MDLFKEFFNQYGMQIIYAVLTAIIGDKVVIASAYAASAYSASATNKAAVGKKRYITKIYEGTNFPYRLGSVKGCMGDTTGFANAVGIKKTAMS